MECTQIGFVETPFESTGDAPRQGSLGDTAGTVHVDADYREGLKGFEDGGDVVVVWYADRAERGLLYAEKRGRGVFSTRSPARPNPICLTECHVEAVDVDAGTVTVTGVDMADGSPLLDLKPVVR